MAATKNLALPVISQGQKAAHNRAADIRLALLLTYITLGWMTVEGGASLFLGWLSKSLLLEAFGIDSVVEIFSAAVLLWRLKVEARGDAGLERVEAVERRAAKLVGSTLYVLAVYVALNSAYGLFINPRLTDTHESAWGIVIGLVAKVGMPVLAGYKLRVAARLNSRALRADAMESITCGYLSIVLMVGLAASRVFGWWWLDSVAALVLIPFLIKEGREAIRGEGCSCCADSSCDAAREHKGPFGETRRMPPHRSPRRADPPLAISSRIQSLMASPHAGDL